MDETEAKPWLSESVDRKTLKDVVELWFKLRSKSLTAGEHVHNKLILMVNALAPPHYRFNIQNVRTLSR